MSTGNGNMHIMECVRCEREVTICTETCHSMTWDLYHRRWRLSPRTRQKASFYLTILVVTCLFVYNTLTLWGLSGTENDWDEADILDRARYMIEQKPVSLEFDTGEFLMNIPDKVHHDRVVNMSRDFYLEERQRVRRARSIRVPGGKAPVRVEVVTDAPQVYHLDPDFGNLTEVTLKTFKDAIQTTFDDVINLKDPEKPFYKRVAFMNYFIKSNPYNFSYVINNPAACKGERVDLFIYVHSDPEFCTRRQLIRNTWGSIASYKGVTLKVMFVIGYRNDEVLQMRLVKENAMFGDLIQGSFIDNYANIRHKDVLGLKWVAEHCGNSRYTMKLDDDIFVNFYKLASFLRDTMSGFHHQTIACPDMRLADVPPRNPASKWYLEPRDYPYDVYPPYCSGMAYVMRSSMAAQIYIMSTKVQPLWLDDIWLTGIVANYLDVRHHYLNFTELYPGYHLNVSFLDRNYFLLLAHADFPELALFRKHEGLGFIQNSWNMLAIDGTYSGPKVTPLPASHESDVYERPGKLHSDNDVHVPVVVGQETDRQRQQFCDTVFNKPYS